MWASGWLKELTYVGRARYRRTTTALSSTRSNPAPPYPERQANRAKGPTSQIPNRKTKKNVKYKSLMPLARYDDRGEAPVHGFEMIVGSQR